MPASRIFAFALLVAALATQPLTQRSTAQPQLPPSDGRRTMQEQDEHIREKMLQDAARRRNKERQQALKKDADKLFELSSQLKQQVDKSNENILSLDVIKKAEEIEKLAKSVREKMKADGY